MWAESVVCQCGPDKIDNHRTPIFLLSDLPPLSQAHEAPQGDPLPAVHRCGTVVVQEVDDHGSSPSLI